MKYIRLRVWLLFLVLIGGFILLIRSSISSNEIYKSESPVTDEQITESYSQLYKVVTQRDAEQLKEWLTHDNEQVRGQAWRALAQTPLNSVAPYIDLAVRQNMEEAWFAISHQELSSDILRNLEQQWLSTPAARAGISTVLGRQGDEQSLEFLLDQQGNNGVEEEVPYALAISRLAIRYPLNEDDQVQIIRSAFEASQDQTIQAYLYGWYRGAAQPLTSTARDSLYNRWQVFGTGIDPLVDQYVNKLLKERTTYTMAIYYNGEQELEDHVQLSVELATSLGQLEMNTKHALAARFLLEHPNPHVQKQVLESLKGKLEKGGNLYQYITRTMLSEVGLPDMVWVETLKSATQAGFPIEEVHHNRLKQIPEQSEFLLPEVLAFYSQQGSPDGYLQRVDAYINPEDTTSTLYALRHLNEYWQSLSEGQRSVGKRDTIRKMTFQALEYGDRGVAHAASALLMHEDLFSTEDFTKINATLSQFTLPEDIEVFQAFGSLYNQRYQEQAKPIIDSLSALGSAPLNRSLVENGWEVSLPDETSEIFRLPNWERLWELGRDPVLTLQTQKGTVRMRLYPLAAPATVSMIDSLSRAGAYDGVPFHRVVPNFVVQGGDIERGDGFGGPDFVIPTEPTEMNFTRGAVGIASAGTDTEGSQFFIMHQWKPHLNGNYTLFGEVTDGMEVIDRIIPGDKILSTQW